MKRVVFLGLGIALTVLFLVLSYSDSFNIWEQMMYFNNGYNDSMYNTGMYKIVGWVTVIVPWVVAAIYYYVINSVKFDRWWHWLGVLAAVAVVTPVVCYIVNDTVFADAGLQFVGESIQFEIQTLLYAALMFVIASFSIRWWSTNCRHTPFPQ